jgi:hypothetical protein
MRALVPALVAFLLAASAAQAAPTCLNDNAETVRCATPGAMPLGWTPSPQRLMELQASRAPGPDANTVLEAFVVIALFLAAIALLPEFDGTRPGDWDRQEGDDKRRN